MFTLFTPFHPHSEAVSHCILVCRECSYCCLPSSLVGFTTWNAGTNIWLPYFAECQSTDFNSIVSHSITSLLICKMLKVQIRFSFQLLMKMNNYLLCHANHASLSEWTAHKVNMKSKLTLVLLWTIYQCMLFQRKQIFVFMIFLLIHSLHCLPSDFSTPSIQPLVT